MYDTDFGFGPFWNISNYWEDTLSFALDPDGQGWPNPPWSTLLFRKLTTNIGFRNQFINRYADELNTRFLPNNVINHIDETYAIIEPEILAHYNRWKDDPSVIDEIWDIYGYVDYYVDNMKDFAVNRHPVVKEHLKQQFGLPDYHPLNITNLDTSQGYVEVNENLSIQEDSWSGDYFETVPVKLTAIAEFGYEFSHWSGDLFSENETIEVSLTEAIHIIPNFSSTNATTAIVINEINYRSSPDFNADDWIELYNPNSSSIDLSNWQIKDNDDSHVFIIPQGTLIEGDGYLVIVKDELDFTSVYPNIIYIGELGFGLGSSDSVRLYNSTGTIQDVVAYESVTPWPICADTTGNTLELITSNVDNSLPENWDCVNENGSPNRINSQTQSVEDFSNDSILVYPNPVKSIVYIGQTNDKFDIEVYSILGQKVASVMATNQLDLSRYDEGVYFLRIKIKNNTIVKRVIKN
jgi:hypothetical protein